MENDSKPHEINPHQEHPNAHLSTQRKEKVKAWLKNPYNLAILGILLFALAIRLYYFFQTANQPLWWDESEYMLHAKHLAFGTPDTGWAAAIRPPLFSLIASLFFRIGLGIVSIKLLGALLSFAGVFLVYSVGKELLGKKEGLIAAVIYSVFYLDIFYMSRLLVDVPSLVFSMSALYFMLKREENKWFAYLIFPTLVVGVLLKFTVIVMLPLILLYLLITKKLDFLKEKNLWVSSLLGIIAYVPYGIWSWMKFGNPIGALIGASVGAERTLGRWDVFMQYLTYFPTYIYWILFSVFILGTLVILFRLVLSFDFIKERKSLQTDVFLISWLIFVFIIFGFFINHFEDRYIFLVFPAVFYVISEGFISVYGFISKYQKSLAVFAIVILLLIGLYPMFNYTNNIIKTKLTSYDGLPKAGLWIKDHSSSNDSIISSAVPELTYYSERAQYSYPDNESDFTQLTDDLHPKFMVVTIWERSPDWAYSWADNNSKVKPVQAFYMSNDPSKIDTVIYQFVYS